MNFFGAPLVPGSGRSTTLSGGWVIFILTADLRLTELGENGRAVAWATLQLDGEREYEGVVEKMLLELGWPEVIH